MKAHENWPEPAADHIEKDHFLRFMQKWSTELEISSRMTAKWWQDRSDKIEYISDWKSRSEDFGCNK